jgi:non-heme chloroperoxidase
MRLIRIPLMIWLSVFLVMGRALGQQPSDLLFRDAYVSTNSGIRIHYLQSGRGMSKCALVLIPGWRLPASLWNEQLARFSRTTRVIAIDPRSQGASTKTSDGNTPESRATDLHDVLGSLGVSRSVLVGWSQGVQDVSAYLQRYGTGSVAGVVLVDSPVSCGPLELDIHREFAKEILSNLSIYASHPEEFSNGMVRSLFRKPHPQVDFQALVKTSLQTPTNTGVAMLVADIFGADRRRALATLNKPALVIASSGSPLLDVQREMAATIPSSKFIVIEGTGHAVFVDQPEKFDEALGTFFQSLCQ